ncbi:hypothetical protein SFRURICE_012992 [Spodoptera frugiperda]|nr:hypothetical protein SFRURICE_012992 [Spodoptera frugiperda]
MGKQTRVDPPTATFPYPITKRLNILSQPRKGFVDTSDGPGYTQSGIRKSALNGHPSDRVNDIAWPWLRRLMIVKKTYRNKFDQERLEKLDRMIEASNGTLYSKLAHCTIDLKRQQDAKDFGKKRGWTESEWKKHMDYIGTVAAPKKEFRPPPVKTMLRDVAVSAHAAHDEESLCDWKLVELFSIIRGKSAPLEALMPRINEISSPPEFKCYKRESKQIWYKDPIKVPPAALKYQITDRVKKLAAPRSLPDA